MKKQLTIIFIFFLNISFLLNGSIQKNFSLSIFDSIKENLSNQHLSEKPHNLIKAGQKHIVLCPNFLCVELEIIEDNYHQDRLEENQNCRIPFDDEDIAYSSEEDHIVLPIQDNNYNLITRYALCKIILNNDSINTLAKSQDITSIESNDSFYLPSESSSNSSSSVATSPQNNLSINTSFNKTLTSLRKKSLSQYIEEKGQIK